MKPVRPILRIHHVKLRVRDLDRSSAFYTELFGFQEVTARSSAKVRECMIRDAASGAEFGIVLTQWSQQEVVAQTLDHICLEVATYDDVLELYKEAKDAGVEATRPRFYERHWQTFIFDPDGHKIEVLTQDKGPSCESEMTRTVGSTPTH